MTPHVTAHWTTPTGHTRTTQPTDAGCATPATAPCRPAPWPARAGTTATTTTTLAAITDDAPPF